MVLGPAEDGRPVVVPDPERARPGRGAWLHPTVSCLDLAVRRRAFGRALRSSTPPELSAVEGWVRAHAQEDQPEHSGEHHDRKRV
ncbi:YlxR family protein [Oryzobacter sp. R7]|uniref:YlxR family protein n=1 Tax=Oryzobacter faecalis TaxID=3388656 RepID=UPI00398CBBC9